MTMFDFSGLPFFDNHTHTYDLNKRDLVPMDMADTFLHGLHDVFPDSLFEKVNEGSNKSVLWCNDWGSWRQTSEYFSIFMATDYGEVSDALLNTTHNLGVVKVLINHLSKYLGCNADFASVAAARNKVLAEKTLEEYAAGLYQDQNIIGSVVDSDLPPLDKGLKFPCPVYRLLVSDPIYFDLLHSCKSWAEVKEAFIQKITWMFTEGGFACVKTHPLEMLVHPMHKVTDEEAEAAFAAAQAGDVIASEEVYCAMYGVLLKLAQKLNFTVHLHSGGTGESLTNHARLNPFFMADMLADPEYIGAKVVFLHASQPWTRELALMCHTYPNVYADIGWTLPWASLNIKQTLRELMAVAPHNKILLGTGQHNLPEISWLAARVSKRALADIMEEYVQDDLLSKEQAQETAEQILYKNCSELYKDSNRQ